MDKTGSTEITPSDPKGCCYKILNRWYFETSEESCNEIGASLRDSTRADCEALNQPPMEHGGGGHNF